RPHGPDGVVFVRAAEINQRIDFQRVRVLQQRPGRLHRHGRHVFVLGRRVVTLQPELFPDDVLGNARQPGDFGAVPEALRRVHGQPRDAYVNVAQANRPPQTARRARHWTLSEASGRASGAARRHLSARRSSSTGGAHQTPALTGPWRPLKPPAPAARAPPGSSPPAAASALCPRRCGAARPRPGTTWAPCSPPAAPGTTRSNPPA